MGEGDTALELSYIPFEFAHTTQLTRPNLSTSSGVLSSTSSSCLRRIILDQIIEETFLSGSGKNCIVWFESIFIEESLVPE